MKENRIAAQLYTLREFLQTPEDLELSLRKVKQIGYDAVQVSGIGPIEASLVQEITEELGITVCATHVAFGRLKEELNEVIRIHRLWNCEYVGLGSMPQEYRTSQDGYRAFIRDFSEIGRELEANGLHLVYHNHNFEFEKFDGVTGMELILAAAGPETYSLELDTFWIQAGGGSVTDWIERSAGRTKVVHLKDMAIVSGQQVFAEIGEGNLPWGSLIQVCRDSGVEWYVVEQDECRRDAFESLAMSLSYLKELL